MARLDLLLVAEVTVLLANDHHIPLGWPPGTLSAPYDHLPVTGNQRVSSEALLAPADWSVVSHLALCVLAAGPDAGVSAVVIEAGQAAGTLVVIFTLALPTADEGISFVPGWASAGGGVSGGNTVSIGTAGVGVAGVRFLLAAGDGVWSGDIAGDALAHRVTQTIDIALGVGATGTGVAWIWGWSSHLNLAASCDGIRLRLVSWQTGAHGVTLPVLIALSVGSTRTWITRVRSWFTSVIVADIARSAVGVHLAFPPAALDGVRHWDEAGQAPTHGVALPVLHALGVGTAGTGLTGVRSGHASLALANVS